MPSPKRRAKLFIGDLTSDEEMFLKMNYRAIAADGTFAFHRLHPAGSWTFDERAARRAWSEHRERLIAGHAPWTCWAAREWEGAAGAIGPYEHLMVLGGGR